jgi:hypothetical protein|tara:strand:+ start:405 stop:650 length:246 start_codon:yes stop_codon:yes gene_type:complete
MSLKVTALSAKYKAKRLEALATLEVYMENPVGIGEHPQILDEIDKLVKTVSDYDGYLATLNTLFVQDEPNQPLSGEGSVNS